MKYFFRKIKKHIGTLAQIVVVFGAAALVLLYFLGYYDFSFLDRYAIFSDSNGNTQNNPFVSIEIDPAGKHDETNDAAQSETDSSAGSGGMNDMYVAPEDDEDVYNTARIFNAEDFADSLLRIKTVSRAADDGYVSVPSDGSYTFESGKSILAKVVFDFKLPKRYANRARDVMKEVIVTPGENGENTDDLMNDESYVVLEETRESRPAVELYMGYIILDDGEQFYLLDSSGTPLCRYDADRYQPAYTRDLEGRPLFKRDDGYYFHISDDGASFVYNDYDPDTDGRGLNFDYPLLWGKSDSTSVFVVSEPEADVAAMTELYGEEFMEAVNTGDEEALAALAELTLPTRRIYGYEVRNADGWVIGKLTENKFTMALPFRENRAAVTTDEDRGSLYFINQNGYRSFVNMTTYLNEHNRYVTEYVMPPLTRGIESIGHFYYENGIVRIRKQVVDYWNYEVREKTRIVKDYDCLVRLDGSEIPLPAGYTLEGYSDGRAILSKNGYYGVYDITGRWIAQPIYVSAKPYMSGLCVLTLPDGRCGMIDTEGNIVLPFTYDSISSVSSGLIATYRGENGWVIYTIMEDPDYVSPAEDAEP